MELKQLVHYLDELLLVGKIQDYCPNGLQIEGSRQINKIIAGVSICQELIDHAIKSGANAIITHHGLLWNKASPVISGVQKSRIKSLLLNDISLIAYHLPLDSHSTLGNNAQLATLLDITTTGHGPHNQYLCYGTLNNPMLISEYIQLVEAICNTKIAYYGNNTKLISTVAWCTGGGDSFYNEAIDLGVDLYITGEASEPVYNLARESGVGYLSIGHYVSERYGIMALARYIRENLQIDCEFIEIYNPI